MNTAGLQKLSEIFQVRVKSKACFAEKLLIGYVIED
jgi:hypothetical protein